MKRNLFKIISLIVLLFIFIVFILVSCKNYEIVGEKESEATIQQTDSEGNSLDNESIKNKSEETTNENINNKSATNDEIISSGSLWVEVIDYHTIDIYYYFTGGCSTAIERVNPHSVFGVSTSSGNGSGICRFNDLQSDTSYTFLLGNDKMGGEHEILATVVERTPSKN